MPWSCWQHWSVCETLSTYGSTGMNVIQFGLLWWCGFGDFLQEGKTITVSNKSWCEVLFLLCLVVRLCDHRADSFIEALDNTTLYRLYHAPVLGNSKNFINISFPYFCLFLAMHVSRACSSKKLHVQVGNDCSDWAFHGRAYMLFIEIVFIIHEITWILIQSPKGQKTCDGDRLICATL